MLYVLTFVAFLIFFLIIGRHYLEFSSVCMFIVASALIALMVGTIVGILITPAINVDDSNKYIYTQYDIVNNNIHGIILSDVNGVNSYLMEVKDKYNIKSIKTIGVDNVINFIDSNQYKYIIYKYNADKFWFWGIPYKLKYEILVPKNSIIYLNN